MRCYSCNKVLTTQESVRRFKGSGDFVDLCNGCLSTISEDVDTVDGCGGEEVDDEEPE